MAYPMARCPTFKEVRQRLEAEFDCRYVVDEEVRLNGVFLTNIERDVDGVTLRCAFTYDDNERLPPSEVRSICARLRISVSAFNMHLN